MNPGNASELATVFPFTPVNTQYVHLQITSARANPSGIVDAGEFAFRLTSSDVTPVPEPKAYALLFTFLVLLPLYRSSFRNRV